MKTENKYKVKDNFFIILFVAFFTAFISKLFGTPGKGFVIFNVMGYETFLLGFVSLIISIFLGILSVVIFMNSLKKSYSFWQFIFLTLFCVGQLANYSVIRSIFFNLFLEQSFAKDITFSILFVFIFCLNYFFNVRKK